MTAEQKRQTVCAKYAIIIGRNIYNQTLRDYCYKPYKDGKYYSDCSSSISYAYKEAEYGFGILNTAGMYTSYKLTTVDAISQTAYRILPGFAPVICCYLQAQTQADQKR